MLMMYMQVLGHAAAAQSAHLIFIAVQREHYDFLVPLANQLKGKVAYMFYDFCYMYEYLFCRHVTVYLANIMYVPAYLANIFRVPAHLANIIFVPVYLSNRMYIPVYLANRLYESVYLMPC